MNTRNKCENLERSNLINEGLLKKAFEDQENRKKYFSSKDELRSSLHNAKLVNCYFKLKSCYVAFTKANISIGDYQSVDIFVTDRNDLDLYTDVCIEKEVERSFPCYCVCQIDEEGNAIKGGSLFLLDHNSTEKLVIRNVYHIDEDRRRKERMEEEIRKKLTKEELEFIKKFDIT